MANCGTCHHRTVPKPAATPLLHIRRGYHAGWNDLEFSVDSGLESWTLRIQESVNRETLYTAERAGARAAQVAAAEFAIFRVLGPRSRVTPERLAAELDWQQH